MDEFAQSREDNDLFADEFEPLPEPTTTIEPAIEAPKPVERVPPRHTAPYEPRGGHKNGRGQDAKRGRGGRGGGGAHQNNGLAQSKYAPQNESKPAPRAAPVPAPETVPVTTPATAPVNEPVAAPKPETRTTEPQEPTPQSPPATDNTHPQAPTQPTSTRTPAVRGDRSATGGPAHKKLTEEELTAKLEKMAILNAQKSAQHRAQEADQAAFQHREKELAKERREKLVEEKKNRSQMEAERAKNRLRKIQHQGIREWDSEKVEDDIVDARKARTSEYVRGGHGGVIRGRGGLGGSRYADVDDAPEEPQNGRRRGGFEIRGRGRGGGGRGGKTGGSQQIPTSEDFPSLPASSKSKESEKQEASNPSTEPKKQEAPATPAPRAKLPTMEPGGAWADEMATPVEEKKEIAASAA
jgi:hypothetical protein